MKTILLSSDDPNTPAVAAELLRKGELVAIPTETVYWGPTDWTKKPSPKFFWPRAGLRTTP